MRADIIRNLTWLPDVLGAGLRTLPPCLIAARRCDPAGVYDEIISALQFFGQKVIRLTDIFPFGLFPLSADSNEDFRRMFPLLVKSFISG